MLLLSSPQGVIPTAFSVSVTDPAEMSAASGE
jgi:hypothetical protein